MGTFYIKKGDTSPDIQTILRDVNNNPVNLTGASYVFIMRKKFDGDVKINETATLVGPPSNGTLKYIWDVGDTDEAAFYDVEWEVTFAGGAIETFPNSTYDEVKIYEDLGDAI